MAHRESIVHEVFVVHAVRLEQCAYRDSARVR